MSQQINLYQERFRKQVEWLSAGRMVAGLAVLLTLIGGLAAFDVWRLQVLDERVAALTQESTRQQAIQAQLKTTFMAQNRDPHLAAQVHRMEMLLAYQEPLRGLLQADGFRSGEGYAGYFVALARQHVPGMWLTGVRIAGAGKEISLAGKTYSPELLPRYLQRLSQEPVLAGTDFDQFLMERAEDDDKRIAALDFTVTTGERQEE